MIQIQIRTNTTRKVVTAETANTPREVFSANSVDTSMSMVNLSGTILSASDLGKTFADLGVADGASVTLNCIVKADGANA